MSDLTGQIGELQMTITVTRKESGKKETFNVIGKVMGKPEEEKKESENGSDSQ